MFIDELIEGCELTLTARFGSKTASFSSKAVEITSPKDKKEISGFIERHEGGLFLMWWQRCLPLTDTL